MGQARLRGTREQRVNAALEIEREHQEARDRAEMVELKRQAKRWSEMTQEQKDAALERAKQQASNYGELQEMFGHDAALALSTMM